MSLAAAHPDDYPRAALVTGGGQRIGRAIAKALAATGWAVAVHYRSSAGPAAELVESIRAAGGRAEALQADLAKKAEVQTLVARATKALGPLGLLVNNASHFERDTLEGATRESWDRHLEPNLRAPFVLMQAFAGQVVENSGGLIVNLLDQRVVDPGPTFISYGVSKSGLWALTQSLALAMAPRIRVNAIAPGFTLPDPSMTQEQFNRFVAKQPLGRSGSPEEIVQTLLFFLSAKSVTGQVVVLDGGQHLA